MQTKKGKNSNNKKILVIGGVAAGSSAASKAKRIDPDADVKIIQDESVVSYGACGMPYVIEGINRRKGHSSEYISLLDIK
jgi:NADPH-dependent 2,4-dienoyl-CoA reductase/sulfur reductase-like enzyme